MIFRFGLHLSICLFILISRLLSFFLPFLLPPTTTIPQQLFPVCLARYSSNFQHYISSFPWFHLKFSRYRKPSNVQNRQHIFMMHNLIHWRLLEGFFQEKQRLRILHHLFSRRPPISPLSPAFIPLLLRSNRGEGESETAGQYTLNPRQLPRKGHQTTYWPKQKNVQIMLDLLFLQRDSWDQCASTTIHLQRGEKRP